MNGSAPAPRIGYVLKMFPRLSETFILNEILELERQGLALRIFSLKRPETSGGGPATHARAHITYLPERVWREPVRVARAHVGVLRRYGRGYWGTLLHVLKGRELRSMVRGLRRFSQTCCLVQEMGDVQHLHAHFATDPTRLASWARMICNIPFSVTTHAKDLYQGDRVNSPGLRYKLSQGRFVVANSQMSTEALRRAFAEAPAAGEPPRRMPPIHTVYNGVDSAAFPFRTEEPAEPLIVAAGRLIEKKGFANLIQACGVLKSWGVSFRCEIAGSGPLEDSLKQQIQQGGLDGTVCLAGSMSHKKLRELYQKALVFALPCIVAEDGDRDILPNVLKEAMAVGVPVVTSRLPGIEELITHGEDGLLTPPNDPEALAASLECLLNDSALRRRLAGRARKVIEERFDMRTNFARLKELLLEATQRKNPPGDDVTEAKGSMAGNRS
jgi:glycosyltransferase involved in cell wall biosynthesis